MERRKTASPGPTLTDVLEQAYLAPFTTKSDFARLAADRVAMAASDGFLTTRIATGLYGTHWRLTPAGAAHLVTLLGMNKHAE